ncbi:hypothetical protein FMV2238Y02_20940 [Streptococcus canis]|uniref:Uncharacterized protein n=1 Tax=Streptococcus canis TaxID=1329 RepID=A0A3P5Y7A6_STRCB|nr:hypothetical protein FMV2238Y02_20940 [Streptococcus canis]
MKKNYILLSAYMIIMGVGLFICNQFLNTPFGTFKTLRKQPIFSPHHQGLDGSLPHIMRQ